MDHLLVFDSNVYNKKTNSSKECPFCDTNSLSNILATKDRMIWLENKFQTLEDVYQTIVIESSKHEGDFDNYSSKESSDIVGNLIKWWNELSNSDVYQSVAMFKNFGYLSGGSLRHPHTQIVGFKKQNCYKKIEKKHFEGTVFFRKNSVQINISEFPITGFLEINVRCQSLIDIDCFSECLSRTVEYIKNVYLTGICNSYNLFFFKLSEGFVCKVIPRFPTSPYVIGYRFSQALDSNTIKTIGEELNKSL
ncbi:DUF4931 domain-containing protein [Enterococcus faecalis]|uniref:DUF4931 domain-containing protein n=1 Tax=Enterococcus faecalis TaxID=1351 RepID=UPI00325AEBEE